MAWATKSFREANHAPVAVVKGPERFTVRSGEFFNLDAEGSWDPDDDSLSYRWIQYVEAGTLKEPVPVTISWAMMNVHTIKAPPVTSPKTVHFVLRVTDKGAPALSGYRRVIVTIVP